MRLHRRRRQGPDRADHRPDRRGSHAGDPHRALPQQQTPELAAQWREIAVVDGHRRHGRDPQDLDAHRRAGRQRADAPSPSRPSISSKARCSTSTPDSVQFEIDGDKIDVRREKLEGLVYYQPAKREFSPPLCRLIDAGGSTWLAPRCAAGRRPLDGHHASAASALELAAGRRRQDRFLRRQRRVPVRPGARFGRRRAGRQPAAGGHDVQVRPRVSAFAAGPPLGADAFRIGGADVRQRPVAAQPR